MLAICKGLSFTPPVPEKNTLSTLPSPLSEVQPSPFCQFFAQVRSCVVFFFPFSFFSLLKTLLGAELSMAVLHTEPEIQGTP